MSNYNEQQIAKVEAGVYSGEMPAHNKAVLRSKLEAEDRFWAKYEAREEEGHSHSVVGDNFNRKEV